MNDKMIYRIIGAIVFVFSLFIMMSTVQPSVSFWDCGEFIASAYSLQVPHPPGTPLFLIIGRLFAMIPLGDNIAFRVNMVSVLSGAFTILMLFSIAVKVINNYKNSEYSDLKDKVFTYISAAIGALSLSFSDTFWFNSIEAEVYGLSLFFAALIVWLALVWYEKADEFGSEKYLILLFYIAGLSTGVHLMGVLAIVPVMMIVVFKKYLQDEEAFRNTALIFVAHAGLLLLISIFMWMSETGGAPQPEDYTAFDSKFKWMVIGISALIMGVFWKKIFTRNSFYIPIIVGGISLVVVYPGIVKYVPELIAAIGKNDITIDILVIVALLSVVGFLIYWSNKNNKPTINLASKAFLFAFIGFSSYAMIIIRSNMDTPINLNSPKTFSELVSYLNREQYGDFPTFKRRFSQEPHQATIYTNYSSDLDFLWNYQMNHMFNRYLMWNYIGKASTVQDDGIDWSQLYGIPFLIAILGIYFHFRKDWKMGSAFMVMFILMGYLTAFYQNQQQPQPRERDYFYVGAYFVFSIWIAVGTRGLIDLIKEEIKNTKFVQPLIYTSLTAIFFFIPINMLITNYHINDRSNNYVPWDYSYNLLQSAAPNAILFTNGDNDTFPLWYLQDVEGVRRDVRIVNLSLLNTPWYIKQLIGTSPYGTPALKTKFTNDVIDRMMPARFEGENLTLAVTQDVYQKFNITDTSLTRQGKISWRMENSVQYGNVKAIRVQDIMVRDFVFSNSWERPIYFAVTCSEDSKIGLNDFLKLEGMAYRLVPYKKLGNEEFLSEDVMLKQLFEEPQGYSKIYQPGFKFRGLNDSTIFFDENHVRMAQNYRNAYLRLSVYYLNTKRNNEMVIKTLDMMESKMPRKLLPIDYRLLSDIADIYYNAGDKNRYKQLSEEIEEKALQELDKNPNDVSSWYNPYRLLIDIYDKNQDYEKALGILLRLQSVVPEDQSINSMIERYKQLANKTDSLEMDKGKIKE